MIFWLDAQLSPEIAIWLGAQYPLHRFIPIRDLGLRDADDSIIFVKARAASAVLITKDSDFVRLVESRGIPPQVVWLRCGNTSNAVLRRIFHSTFAEILTLLETGRDVIELRDK